jgi:hypothetical protein
MHHLHCAPATHHLYNPPVTHNHLSTRGRWQLACSSTSSSHRLAMSVLRHVMHKDTCLEFIADLPYIARRRSSKNLMPSSICKGEKETRTYP